MLIHLLLCLLLAFQQPAVLVRTGAWGQARSTAGDSRETPGNPVIEEEKVPGLYTGSEWRLKKPAGVSGGKRVEPRRHAEPRSTPTCALVQARAQEHWRTLQLPPRGAPDDDPFERV
jgi:hypothetical protein